MRRASFLALCAILLLLAVSCSTGTIIYGEPESSDTVMIFYPGGKVDPYAYEDLCSGLSERGIPVIVAKMPLNLAVLNGNAATSIVKDYPNVDNWVLGGHSLGGVMASSWCAKHPNSVSLLVLLASYPTKEMSLPVLSLYGSEDGVLRMDKYQEGMERISDLEEHVIEGGNHCRFGDYGFQKGDNPALIERDAQTEISVSFIADFIEGHL